MHGYARHNPSLAMEFIPGFPSVPGHYVYGRNFPLFGPNKGTGRCVVHDFALLHPRFYLHPLEIRQGVTMARQGRRPLPDQPFRESA